MKVIRIGENTQHGEGFFVDRPKGHPHYLLLITRTSGRFWYDGEWQAIAEGTAVVFRPGQKHLYGPEEGKQGAFVYGDDWMHIEAEAQMILEEFPYGKPIPLHEPDICRQLFHLIYHEFYGTAATRESIIAHLLQALLYKILEESREREHPVLYYKLLSVRESIYRNPEKNWSIPEISRQIGISEGYFYTLYRQFFYTTCIKDLKQSRILKACEILRLGTKTVEETGRLCGYQNTEHFIRQFREEMGTTPGKWR